MTTQKRSRSRLKFSAHALVKSSARGIVRGVVRDVSIDSIYLKCKPVLEVDEKANVEIILIGKNSELIIKADAKVIRKDEEGLALVFYNPLEWWPIFSQFSLHTLETKDNA